jgi:polyhydroxyalkanoate synthesis regulator phasin
MEMELNYIFTTVLSEVFPDVWFEIIDNHINDKIEKVNIAKEMVKTGLWNRNEAREYTGETIVEDELMNAYTVDSTTKLISDLEFSISDIVTPPTA